VACVRVMFTAPDLRLEAFAGQISGEYDVYTIIVAGARSVTTMQTR
jgi:hypothetical protein